MNEIFLDYRKIVPQGDGEFFEIIRILLELVWILGAKSNINMIWTYSLTSLHNLKYYEVLKMRLKTVT